MKSRIVVIGANAAGAKAAAKARRTNPKAEITVVDRGNFISYGACGIPYYVSDTVTDLSELMSTAVGVVRDAEFFSKVKGVSVRTRTEVTGIDRDSKVVHLLENGTVASFLPYDKLILATGSSPFIPRVSNVDLGNILTVKSIEDAEFLKERAIPGAAVCIVGGGLIGLETAEALHSKGMRVTLIEMSAQLLPGDEMGGLAAVAAGVDVRIAGAQPLVDRNRPGHTYGQAGILGQFHVRGHSRS